MSTSEQISRLVVHDPFSSCRRTYQHVMQPQFSEAHYPLDAPHLIPCGSTRRCECAGDPFGASSYHFRGV